MFVLDGCENLSRKREASIHRLNGVVGLALVFQGDMAAKIGGKEFFEHGLKIDNSLAQHDTSPLLHGLIDVFEMDE